MQTILAHDDDIDPLEVSSGAQHREICDLAWTAWRCSEEADLAIRKAVVLSDEGDDSDDHAIATMMRLASKRDTSCQHDRSELARRLSRAGYKAGDKVRCASVVVLVNRDLMPVTILGRALPETPSDALNAIDSVFNDDWSDRDEAAERAREYAEMVHYNDR
jgi:hypothetical protein